jgi:hypothetical protein
MIKLLGLQYERLLSHNLIIYRTHCQRMLNGSYELDYADSPTFLRWCESILQRDFSSSLSFESRLT